MISVTCIGRSHGNGVGDLLELGHEEAVHVMQVRVKAAREIQRLVETALFKSERNVSQVSQGFILPRSEKN